MYIIGVICLLPTFNFPSKKKAGTTFTFNLNFFPFFLLPSLIQIILKISKTFNAKSASDISPSSFFFWAVMYFKDLSLCTSEIKGNKRSHKTSFVPIIKYKNTALRKIDRRRKGNSFSGMAQSPGLTDEFMCALIN